MMVQYIIEIKIQTCTMQSSRQTMASTLEQRTKTVRSIVTPFY